MLPFSHGSFEPAVRRPLCSDAAALIEAASFTQVDPAGQRGSGINMLLRTPFAGYKL